MNGDDRGSPGAPVLPDRDGHPLGMLAAAVPAASPAPLSVEEERDHLQLLLNVTNAIARELDMTRLFAAIASLLKDTIPNHVISLTLWDDNVQALRRRGLITTESGRALEDGTIASPGSPAAITYRSGVPAVFRWADLQALDAEVFAVMEKAGLRAVCCVPIATPRRSYGTLNVGRPHDAAFRNADVLLLERLAQQLAVAIENATQFQRAEAYRQEAAAQRDRLRLLLDVNNALLTADRSRWMPLEALEALRQMLPHDYASLAVVDGESRELRVVSITYYDGRGIVEQSIPLPLSRTAAGAVFLRQLPRVFDRAALEAFDPDALRPVLDHGITSFCCVPLTTQRGALGTLNIGRAGDPPFSELDTAMIVEVARQVAIAVENAVAFHEISALRDRLREEKLYLEEELTAANDFMGIVGHSAALSAVIQQVRTVAPTDATVLLLGETGTGKELLARAIHDSSRRSEGTFVRFNGAALPSTLVESELFGYERGAFTGAVAARAGRLELAHKGTLFIDEVGDISLDVQPKLLRALQEHEFERLGSTRTQRVDIRLVAATNRDLSDMVQRGQFRSDLYYRLNVFPIRIPPLRERPDDIALLTRHFVRKFASELGREIDTIPAATLQMLQAWSWPGNIRELENVIERAVILSPGDTLLVPASAFDAGPDAVGRPPVSASTRYQDRERETILAALRAAEGQVAGPGGAAARLGLKRTTLHSKMRKLGINRPSF
jgi:formate hydrogenlyase transcriptional activator